MRLAALILLCGFMTACSPGEFRDRQEKNRESAEIRYSERMNKIYDGSCDMMIGVFLGKQESEHVVFREVKWFVDKMKSKGCIVSENNRIKEE